MGEVGGAIVVLAGDCVLLFEVDVVSHCGGRRRRCVKEKGKLRRRVVEV